MQKNLASDVAQYLRPGEFQNLARRSRNLIKTVGWLLGGYVTSEIKGVSLFQIISSSHLHEKEEKIEHPNQVLLKAITQQESSS